WLEDGEHFLQRKEGKLLKVHALTGRSKPFFDQEKLAKALATIPGMSRRDAESRARFQSSSTNSQRSAALIEFQADFYLCPFDGGKAVRLTKGSKLKSQPSFSPDGKWLAFVRDNNLHVVDVATQTEKALTKDGSDLISNGRADW